MTRRPDRGSERSRGSSDLDEAARRFQDAAEDLAASATEEAVRRAAESIDEATAWLHGEDPGEPARERARERAREGRRGRRAAEGDRDSGRGRGARARARERRDAARSALRDRARVYRDHERLELRSRRLYLDDDNGRIVGVCGGIANYFGMEAWVVRCIAVTGLIFMPSIVFPAYWVAYFVMDHPPGEPEKERKRRRRRRRRRRRDAGSAEREDRRRDHTAPAPEMGVRFSPRRSLRAVQDDFVELELRLRRMETHVTSGQYELHRELGKIAD
ncbi:MAG: PspC domain-containing protein [Gammaproteobacteria bacterium]|nr:PspC domain-containing protein [Gammaproteobacteria bacterium]MYE84429.1 PspC domain-containing protein [Gammaproteobacteria bacterium]